MPTTGWMLLQTRKSFARFALFDNMPYSLLAYILFAESTDALLRGVEIRGFKGGLRMLGA